MGIKLRKIIIKMLRLIQVITKYLEERMPRKLFYLLILIGGLAISACATNNIKNDGNMAGMDHSIATWNKMISLDLPPGLDNPLKVGSSITLEIDNISENPIRFPANRNLRIFDIANGKAIRNSDQYIEPEGGPLKLEPKAKRVAWSTLAEFTPDIQENKAVKIRVYVVGEMETDPGKSEPVGAYIDLVLSPLE